eukprot:3420299-Prymnesium_polylepis.2
MPVARCPSTSRCAPLSRAARLYGAHAAPDGAAPGAARTRQSERRAWRQAPRTGQHAAACLYQVSSSSTSLRGARKHGSPEASTESLPC